MRALQHPLELLRSGESALAVFTRGSHFHVNADGTGATGLWDVRAKRVKTVDRVIVYRQVKTGGEIWIGTLADVEGPIDVAPHSDGRAKRRRHRLLLSDIKLVGQTDKTWPDFVAGGSRQIRYFRMP